MDYGLVRCGLAVSDPEKMIAGPLDVIRPDELLSWLKEYLNREVVESILIGMPYELDGSTLSGIEKNIQSFIVNLKKELPDLPIKRIDERFTSKMASRSLLKAGLNKMKRRDKSLIDKMSAAIMLQEHLDQLKSKI